MTLADLKRASIYCGGGKEITNRPKPKRQCRNCKTMVTATLRPGFGHNQVMAFYSCPRCNSKWHHDVDRDNEKKSLQSKGILDENGKRTAKFLQETVARKIEARKRVDEFLKNAKESTKK